MAQNPSPREDDVFATVSSPYDHLNNGWDDAARAIHSVLKMAAPIRISLQPDDHAPYVVDFQRRAFQSTSDLTDFPTDPVRVGVQTYVVSPDHDEPLEPARNLELLLWNVGRSSFRGELAPWLSSTVPYRLTAWPDFTGVFHTTFHLRLTAHLANHITTVEELIEQFQVDAETVNGAINAFSLLGILENFPVRSAADAPTVGASDPASDTSGLWSRLRDRLGL
jgi:hypothetical protein